MALDDNFLHRMTLRFVGAINKVKEEKFRELNEFFQTLQKGTNNKNLIALFEKIESEVSDKFGRIINSITVKAIGHLGHIREEIIQKGIALEQVTEIATKTEIESETPPLTQTEVTNAQKIKNASKIKEEITRRNRILKELLEAVPQFKVLAIMEKTKANTYDVLHKATGYSLTTIRNYCTELEESEYIAVDKSRIPHIIELKKTPW